MGSGLDLSIIVVNYNTCDLLRDCLCSIYKSQDHFSYQVFVVDNCSSDGSRAMVRSEFPQVHLIESPVNGGYAYANNLGLRATGFRHVNEDAVIPDASSLGPRYVLLLNPDTLLPSNALQEMIAFMDGHPEAGVAGPKLVRADGSLDLACRRSFPTPEVSFYRMLGLSRLFPRSRRFGRYNLTYLDPDQPAEVDAVVGAFMMVRGQVLHQVGLLDESFFMYAEDLDWCKRIKEARNPHTGQPWKVLYNPAVTVLHYKRAASQHSKRASYEFYRTMYTFYQKHYAADTPFWLHWLVVGGIVLRGGIPLLRNILSLPAKTEGDGEVAEAAQ